VWSSEERLNRWELNIQCTLRESGVDSVIKGIFIIRLPRFNEVDVSKGLELRDLR
jgi:hypothetical protein